MGQKQPAASANVLMTLTMLIPYFRLLLDCVSKLNREHRRPRVGHVE